KAQMDCGFQGIRLQTTVAVRESELLDIIGKAGGTPYIEGNEGYRVAADTLVGFLERYPACVVCGTHFAGPTDPSILSRDAAVARLFGHPRFLVIFSRQGYMDPVSLKVWTQAVVKVAGWERLLHMVEEPGQPLFLVPRQRRDCRGYHCYDSAKCWKQLGAIVFQ